MNASINLIGKMGIITLSIFTFFWFIPKFANAHCDTLAGPVVITAKAALEKGDVTPVLKWVKKENEKEVREAFAKTLAVRKHGKEAKELADMYFFETLVRIHRAGEGAAYTGLKPVEAIEPVTAESDKALESGNVDKLIKEVSDAAAKGIREKFTKAIETKKNADRSIEAGREYVEAYVVFTHYVERIYNDAATNIEHHMEMKEPAKEGHEH